MSHKHESNGLYLLVNNLSFGVTLTITLNKKLDDMSVSDFIHKAGISLKNFTSESFDYEEKECDDNFDCHSEIISSYEISISGNIIYNGAELYLDYDNLDKLNSVYAYDYESDDYHRYKFQQEWINDVNLTAVITGGKVVESKRWSENTWVGEERCNEFKNYSIKKLLTDKNIKIFEHEVYSGNPTIELKDLKVYPASESFILMRVSINGRACSCQWYKKTNSMEINLANNQGHVAGLNLYEPYDPDIKGKRKIVEGEFFSLTINDTKYYIKKEDAIKYYPNGLPKKYFEANN